MKKRKVFEIVMMACFILSGCGGDATSGDNKGDTSSSEKMQYVITFDLNGGKTDRLFYSPKTVDHFGTDIFFYDVEKEGYSFRGWSYKGEKIVDEKGSLIKTPEMESEMTFVAIFEQNVRLTITTNMPEAGEIGGEGIYEYNSNVDVFAHPYQGYYFDGWYYEDTLISRSTDYKYMMWNVDVVLEARFELASFNMTIKSNFADYGLVMFKDENNKYNYYSGYASNKFKYTDDLTIVALSQTDVRFLGWYDENDELVSTNAVYTFKMVNHDYQLEARWIGGLQKLTVTSRDASKGNVEIISGDGYTGEKITVKATAAEGCLFKCWYEDDKQVSTDETYTFTMPAKDRSLTAEFWTNEENLGITPLFNQDTNTVRYGLYPQTHMNDKTLITSLNELTNVESNGWYLYGGEYYAKKAATPYYNSNYRFNDGTTITKGTEYWFKCEPIEWNILSSSDGTCSLVSSALLDVHRYYSSTSDRTIDGETVYANNYEHSDIRSWLNGGFYDSAFALDDSLIQTVTVDNSAATTGSSTNKYACNDTQDKVYLLSYQDYENVDYFANDASRCCKPTDWAKVNGAYVYTNSNYYGNCFYWTRSPYSSNSTRACYVFYGGNLYNHCDVDFSGLCVRPGLQIKVA